MGFFRRLFRTTKKPTQTPPASKPPNRRWTFAKHPGSSSSSSANKHAMAVAAATAAVAEAALAAAHAAAEVVRLTSAGAAPTTPTTTRRPAAAVAALKIQSAFRGYLARRALRALKALVKLQALVRGHIVRKQTADMLRRMQTMVRLQAQARASRVLSHTMHSFKSSLSHYPVPEEYEHHLGVYSTKFDGSCILKRCSSNANFRNSEWERARLERWMEERESRERNNNNDDDEKISYKILEVDKWKAPVRRSSVLKGKEEALLLLYSRTADNSPQASSSSRRHGGGSSSSRKGPFTPTRSECSFHGYAGHPNYMSNTLSSTAKVRSQSAPRQRLHYDRYGYYGYGYGYSTTKNKAHLPHAPPPSSSSRFNRIGTSNLR